MNIGNKKRLVKDIASIIKEPLTEQGIYYIHDEENMLEGYALIIGQEDSYTNMDIIYLNLILR